MKDYSYYLNLTAEIGSVEQIVHSLVYVSGLPGVHPKEIVVFESGAIGQVMSLTKDSAQVLLLSREQVRVGASLTRTNEYLQISIDNEILGKTVDPLGNTHMQKRTSRKGQLLPLEVKPLPILERKPVERLLETGVGLVDLVVPLGKGQRELVIGDRKTGKTDFILQTMLTQAALGTICVYALIGQKQSDILQLDEFLQEKGIRNNTVLVAAGSSEPSGLIFLAPYTAMTISEYFRDQGLDVLLILDDMTTHARTYREISLLARRFPGRSSYPGDIFYAHARLIERAGNFIKGSITCLPVAESILGDLSGYIQTNLMSMTDGHIFFDIELYNQGKRPSLNPFLSVTRVGHQTQTPLQRDISNTISSFLVGYERMKQFMHFGSEAGESTRNTLALGERIDVFFNQGSDAIIPLPINMLLFGSLWAGMWNDIKTYDLKKRLEPIIQLYLSNADFRKKVISLIQSSHRFSDLVNTLKRDGEVYIPR